MSTTRLPTAFVALTTTGPSPAEDRVVEVAGRCGEDTFSSLAAPGRLTPAVLALVGLKRSDLTGKPEPAVAIDKLLAFCAHRRTVLFDEPTVGAFMVAEGRMPPDCIDARELAHIVCPTATDYTLAGIASVLGVEADESRRAAARAHVLARVWDALVERLSSLPPSALEVMCRIARAAEHPLADAIEDAGAAAEGFSLSAEPSEQLRRLFKDNNDLLSRAQKNATEEGPSDTVLPTDAICRMFYPKGAVGAKLPQFEYRAEQVEMVRAVCEALNYPRHLMVEAGTGTGKSMAYLVPMIAWAVTNRDKVVISTNTRNLQEQLFHKDLPFLHELLPGRFESALLKGRTNYLCVRRFLQIVRAFERELGEPDEYAALLPLVSWAAGTESGDLAECNGFFAHPRALALIPMFVTTRQECRGRACGFRRRCFVYRARALAQLSDLAIVNHAVVFAELGLDSPVLPPHRCMVFDEAHNLEDVATDSLATEIDGLSVYRVTNFLHRPRRDGSSSGLLANTMHECAAHLSAENNTRVVRMCGDAMEAVNAVVDESRQFFEIIGEPFLAVAPSVERIAMHECQPPLGPGSKAWKALASMEKTCNDLKTKVELIAQELEDNQSCLPGALDMAGDLRAQTTRLAAIITGAEFCISAEEENYVYWLQRVTRDRGTFYSAHGAPLEIGSQMRNFFFNEKRSVILTSATLQVDGSFEYMRERLGADELEPEAMDALSVGSPFNYHRQAMIGVTTFLPDPGGRRDRTYDSELASFLIDLLQCTQGRALVLFTSYSLLSSVYETIKGQLERVGILVLAQGHSGSREAITATFRHVKSSVLLGTRSFWEGVDVSGEALSCLVMTKLPFHVFTDPLVRGRTEFLRAKGREPFGHYTLPEAVISFRQGFGRLIRTQSDTGVIICTDRRLVTKGYGRAFLNSVPGRHLVFPDREHALDAVGEFFGHEAG